MVMQARALDEILKKIRTRSTLFDWLLETHDQLLSAARGGRIPWTLLYRELAKQGLMDMTGKPPTPETVRKTWERVRKEKKRIEEREARERAERDARREIES